MRRFLPRSRFQGPSGWVVDGSYAGVMLPFMSFRLRARIASTLALVACAAACAAGPGTESPDILPTDGPDAGPERPPPVDQGTGMEPNEPDEQPPVMISDAGVTVEPDDESTDEDFPDAATSDAGDAAVIASELGEQLFGHWSKRGNVGDCYDLQSWYTFSDDARVVVRSIDDNACYGPMLLSELSGTYAVDGAAHELSIALPGASFDAVRLSSTSVEIAASERRMTIAIGERPADAWRPAQELLDDEAFVSEDGARYRSVRYVRHETAAGETWLERDEQVELTIDPPLPLAAGASCHITVRYTLTELDREVAPDPIVDDVAIELDAIVQAPVAGWTRVVADEVAAAEVNETWPAWVAMLDERGLDSEAVGPGNRFASAVFPSFNYRDDAPNVLSVALPESGSWLHSPQPPPVP